MQRWFFLAAIMVLAMPAIGQADPYLSGRACMIQGSNDSAVVHLEKALEDDPGNAEILYHLGVSHFKLQNNTRALEAFYSVEKRKPGMGSLYLARTEMRLNHPEQALKYLRVHLDSRYKVQESEILLDEDLSKLEVHPGWKDLWEEKRWYSPGDEELREAQFMLDNGNSLDAINILNRLDKQGFKRSLVKAEKAGIYEKLGNRKAAVSELASAVKSDVRNLDALQALAVFQIEDGSYEDAIAGLTRVIRQDPARFNAYLSRAEARSMNGDIAGAREDMELYLTYFPSDDMAYFRKGKIEYSHGKYLDAIQSFNKSLELNSGNPEYYFARGMTYASTGTTRYAEKDMSMALDLDPLNGDIWFEKGKLAVKLGKREDACHCFQKAIQYGVYEALDYRDQSCN